MASDLSKLIQDSFTLTLNGLLAKDAKILKITKAHPYDLEDTQLLQVQALFDLKTLSTKFSYYIPAKSASLIFNTMMGSPITDLSDEIDDDAEDAISEFISNACGGLTTAINSNEYEDIGQTKFNIAHKEILNGEKITNLDSTFRFLIDLEDEELVIFIGFEENILPFIETISKSEITFHQERAPKVEEEEIIEEIENKVAQNETNEIEKNKTNNEKITKKIKFDKKQLIMIGGGVISLIAIVLLVLYFLGGEEPVVEDVQKEDLNATQKMIPKPTQVEVVQYTTLKKVDFKASDIDKNRLNDKLKDLTKYSVLSEAELAQQKEQERIRLLELAKEKELIEFAKRNHEEPLVIKNNTPENSNQQNEQETADMTIKKETQKVSNEENNVKMQEVNNEDKTTNEINEQEETLKYVVTTSLKYKLFKSVVQQTNTTRARISICNNTNGKTTIYIGPFENEVLQNKMVSLAKEKNNELSIEAINITEEDFNSRCNLE